MARAIAYIDGFNLYWGLRTQGWKKYYWLNAVGLVQSLLSHDQELRSVKYFTSRVRGPHEKVKRQATFLEALQTLPRIQIFYGHYLFRSIQCPRCGGVRSVPEEKMTDVNLAVEMLCDAFTDQFDVALLVSADSDLVAPVKAIRRFFPSKRVVIGFPPARRSVDLRRAASGYVHVDRATLAASQFPDIVRKPDGFELHRPVEWR